MKWNSKITKVEPNHLVTCGYRQEDLIGNIPFSNVVYLLLKGELPSKEHGRMIDAILTACVDHGVTPPSAMASRVVASGGVPLPTAVAAGVLAIGDVHGGAIEKGAKLLQENVVRMKKEDRSIEEIAASIVKEAKEQKKRILGFGHRVHTSDPRTKRLFSLAEELHIAGDHVMLSKAIEVELEKSTGRKLPINVDGAIAAIISDMGFDWRLGKGFFLIGRVVGLTAHVYEEQTREKPMRKMFTVDCEYDGPEEKDI
ncbi:MAG: citryl-CoA lyase [Thermoplasmata archaeon]|nr:MAG: citryl-CoA lyase [Thermoplasmata archaeon]RLF36928.1 MAG: citryl-CoA lyase [Thermoplasmata archaeon]RLF52628.1 MAG: citryl-CoA lyase [Thermoplasmata archaeon]